MRISGGNMIQNVKNFSLVLFCCLFLSLCTACTRALTGNIETPSPMPTQPEATIPSNSPEATLHEWSGDGFSYTSKNLGITVEFPPEWENLMTISDDITYEYFVEGQSEPLNCVTLKAIHGGENGEILGRSSRFCSRLLWRRPHPPGPESSLSSLRNRGIIMVGIVPMYLDKFKNPAYKKPLFTCQNDI